MIKNRKVREKNDAVAISPFQSVLPERAREHVERGDVICPEGVVGNNELKEKGHTSSAKDQHILLLILRTLSYLIRVPADFRRETGAEEREFHPTEAQQLQCPCS